MRINADIDKLVKAMAEYKKDFESGSSRRSA